mgnify:CR=1 FL=1|tara:strand:+ start:203 stop:1144 length:942 start_codon:yes stop_codon:yes gene_type:complete
MEKLDCEFLIKGVVIYLKKYNLEKTTWSKTMNNENIPIQYRNLLNGVRFVYSNEVNDKIKNCCIKRDLINLLPTGSNKLSSDIDTSIEINITHKINIKLLENVVDYIIKILNDTPKLWNIESIEKTLDINYYPPTLFNMSDVDIVNNHYILSQKDKNIKNMFHTMWVPQLKNKKLYKKFYDVEMKHLEDYEKKYKYTNTNYYYDKYSNNKIKCLFKLINNRNKYKKNNIEDDEEINNNILCLMEYAHIGPEMYFTYSSVLFIVWFFQLKHNVSKSLLKKLAPIVKKEHQLLYKITGKQKYKDRVNLANKYIDH